jgi:L-serine dehydratase
MESISVFDILKIGIGPSSSHTMGPWRAVQMCFEEFNEKFDICSITQIQIELFGSLAKTGGGHGTSKAIMLAISGFDPVTIDTSRIDAYINEIKSKQIISVFGKKQIPFDPLKQIIFNRQKQFDFHSNALEITIYHANNQVFSGLYFSIGGGFVVKGPVEEDSKIAKLPFPVNHSHELLTWCKNTSLSISDIVFQNELTWRSEAEIHNQLQAISDAMLACVYKGCHTTGHLPGGLNVKRRASYQSDKLIISMKYNTQKEWIELIKKADHSFKETLNWVSCFALAVNEENASFSRVVTAPTNGAAGVIPAVLMYYLCLCDDIKEKDLHRFLLVAGEIGSIFKKGATISAAMGGCMAEIGVSSAMAAAALTEVHGGTPEKVLMAAEIAMEHHLGLTCDPIGGLVQIPCIERNAMGAMKAITASQIALASDPTLAKVSLDDVIKTMWNTAEDMNSKYKETSEGGLAINIPVSIPDC